MAAYSSVLLRKEQAEEREEAHKADACALFLLSFFLVDQLSDYVQQHNLCQRFQNGLYASISIKIQIYCL